VARKIPAGIASRAAAQAILAQVLRKRRPLDAAVDSVLAAAALEPRDAGFARAIATETLRRLGQLQALIHHFVPKQPPEHRAGPTLEILLAGACELLFLKVPPHATVDAANELAAADGKAVHFKSLINAVLRRISREGEAAIAVQDAPRLNTPDWLWSRWSETYGDDTAHKIATAHLVPPPLDLHMKAIATADCRIPNAESLPGNIMRLHEFGRIEDLPGFAEGEWCVQDFAASLPARLLGDVRGQTVIDLCAARRCGGTRSVAHGASEGKSCAAEPGCGMHCRRCARVLAQGTRAVRAARCALQRDWHHPASSRSAVEQERGRRGFVCRRRQ
jgi:16S rRNA (cytosine967-C5)-methyltransferase